jgi:hypothetical protein
MRIKNPVSYRKIKREALEREWSAYPTSRIKISNLEKLK